MLSSPVLNFLKKLAGRVSTRIIMDASTPRVIFEHSLAWIISFTLVISCAETSVHRMKIAMATSALVFPLESTGPVSVRLIWGKSRPTRVTTSAATSTIVMSLRVMQSFI